MNEHYDPRSAKRAFGKIGGARTFGGVVGGLLAERVAAMGSIYALILVTAILHLGCSAALYWFTRQYRVPHHEDRGSEKQKSVRQVLKKTPYLVEVASLMMVVSVAAALIDYLFKSQAAATLGRSGSGADPVLRDLLHRNGAARSRRPGIPFVHDHHAVWGSPTRSAPCP